MIRSCIIMLAALFLSHPVFSQADSLQANTADSVEQRIVLIGDAGSLHNGRHYVVNAVQKNIKLDSNTTIVYLGDNLYYTGLPDDAVPGYDVRRAVLDSQVTIAKGTAAKVYFMPGNHDWNREGPGGWEAIVREGQYIDRLGDKNVKFWPEDGCPGPVEVPLNKDVVLIIMDSQWWLHPYDKPGIESDCPYKTKEEVLAQLEDLLSRNSQKLVLFACHHPMKSYGIHGGYFTWKQHIFPFTDMKPNLYIPLPVIGSIYPITRSVFGTPQDLHAPGYQNMIRDLQSVLKQHSNVIYVAGHEHNLQLIKDTSSYYIISGAGTNMSRVSKNKNELYGKQQWGFATLEVSKNKNVNFNFYEVYGDSVVHAYDSTLVNFSKQEPEAIDTVKSVVVAGSAFKDSVIAKAHPEYDSVNSVQRFFLGDNYRRIWATPVQLKVFDLTKQGYTIKSLGGGKQTASLRLADKDGTEWTLRSINKNPEKAIPVNLRGTIAQDIVQDMISASHPYAALAIPDLANAVNVPEAEPFFYYMPDDPALGSYRQKFSNQVVSLELREPTINGENAKSTAKIIEQFIEDNDDRIDEEEVLRARLLDMYIADFDRHFDQWKWGTSDTGEGKVYYAIPRDRDQAFFNSNGLLLELASFRLLPFLKGFKSDYRSIVWFNYVERDFDRFFLNRLDRQTWERVLADFQKSLTDSVITVAVNKMPPEVAAINGESIIEKLKSRRSKLPEAALKYYDFLSKIVTVVGSNKEEYFHISNANDSLKVNVYKKEKTTHDTSSLMYSRVFDPHVTKEIRLFGLNGQDMFEVDSNVSSRIKLRMIGGKGFDTFDINGNVRNYVYDFTAEKNFIVHTSRTKDRTSSDPYVNAYSPTGFQYNIVHFPRLNLGYNVEDKFLVGAGFLRRTYGFRKEPFASEHRISTLFAFFRHSYQLRYQGEFNHVFGKQDILVNAIHVDPTLNNFFGLGNETKIDPAKDISYYEARYRYNEADILLRRRLFSMVHVMAGPTVYHYWNKYSDNSDKILGNPSSIGLDSSSIYSQKTYVGGKLNLLINNLDNVLLPTRGINWLTEFTSVAGVGETSKPYTALTTDMSVHAALTDPAKVVGVLRLGYGQIFSKHYEYFQMMNLGANNILRGFRKDRFSGTALAYTSLELRVKLFQSRSYFLPGDVGIIGFNDLGRVWLRDQKSTLWHDSYGFGFYYTAYNYVLISATMAFSKEEQLFNFSLGTKFNITF